MAEKRKFDKGISKRPLHFIWIVDCAGDMAGEKIASLNQVIREAIPEIRQEADWHPEMEVLVRAIKFSDTATWHIVQPVPAEQIQWPDLEASGSGRVMGEALRLVAEALKVEKMGRRGLPPVLVLVSSGHPTDDFRGGLNLLMQEHWAQKAVRLAIAIGKDADREVLQQFIGNTEIKPLEANNIDAIMKMVGFGGDPTSEDYELISRTQSIPKGSPQWQVVGGNVPIPPPPHAIPIRPLHFIWIVDCAGDIAEEKIASLNQAIREAILEIRQEADWHPEMEVLVRAIKFSDTATWHIAQPVPVEQFQWSELETSGSGRAIGEALRLVAKALKVEKMGKRGLRPMLVLVSDGQPTDDFKGGLNQLMKEPWGKKAVKITIPISKDADRDVLQQFVGREYGHLEASNLDAIKKMINWAFTTPVIIKPPSVPPYSSYPKGVIENDIW